MIAVAVVSQVVGDYLWQIADMIPLLGLTDVIGWNRPTMFAHDGAQTTLALIYPVLVFAPVLAYLAYVFRDEEPVGLPTFPYAGPVEQAVVEQMARQEPLYWHEVNLEPIALRLRMPPGQVVSAVAEEQILARSMPAEERQREES